MQRELSTDDILARIGNMARMTELSPVIFNNAIFKGDHRKSLSLVTQRENY
jgi:hypothetical protein